MFTLKHKSGAVIFADGERFLRIAFMHPGCVRVTCTEGREFADKPGRIVVAERTCIQPQIFEDEDTFRLESGQLAVFLNKRTGSLRYCRADGNLLFQEPARGGRWLTPKKLYRNLFGADTVTLAESIDGARPRATQYTTVFDRMAFETKLEFVFSEDEALFGLGSHEEGYCNLRGRSRELYQQNMKAVVPFLVSTRGYGVLLDCSSLMTFHDDAYGSYWWADAVDELDFYVVQGDSVDALMREYYWLTGPVPMLPKWAFGYVQSKERYVNAPEILDVVREYRRRHIPLDAIVLDWKSWPNGGGWGQKSFDPARFPDVESMTAELHRMGARLMVSIWPVMTGGCTDQQELAARGMMLGNQSTYNAFLPEARACYWEQARRGLFSRGVDAWWCDCSEPFEADWSGAVKPEPHLRMAINTEESKKYLDATEINAYSLLHSQGIYEGQRGVTNSKRVLNLTRSSCAGQHRYATVTWNGDICATWLTLRRSIAEGLNFCASGEPWWTVDIGGFFIGSDPKLWFWRGDYDQGCRGLTDMNALELDPGDRGCRDLGYWELYARWLQYAAFLPMFRSHGTDASREIWRFGDEGGRFYEVLAQYIRLRYRLMPYIYSVAAQVALRGTPMMQALALAFPGDLLTHDIADQYLFGPALLVCPVTEPMYYEKGSRALESRIASRNVYLPGEASWYDFRTGLMHEGGQAIVADAPLEWMPLFVRAGSILPLSQPMQYVDEIPDAPWEIRVYTGADAEFTIYEDAGDGYAYECGEYALVKLRWTERTRTLTFSARQGSFPQLVQSRKCRISICSAGNKETRAVTYSGQEIMIQAQ